MRNLFSFLLLYFSTVASADPSPTSIVFDISTIGKYPSIRIPALICTAKGTLVASIEARNDHKDQAGNDLLVSTSSDNGKTWTKTEVAYEQGDDSLNNPCLVQETKSGTIFLFYQVFPTGTKESGGGLKPGPKGQHRIAYISSKDEGRTWSKPVDVTAEIKPAEAITTASGPGCGIQLQNGKYKGRLIIPFNSQGPKGVFINWIAYSDDAGKTWKRGHDVPQDKIRLNEVQVCETSGGGIYLNSRQSVGTGGRKVAWSTDGGENWTTAIEDKNLPEPVCQGSVLTIPGEKIRLVFLNPQGEPAGKGRKKGVIRLSSDDGKTWEKSRVLVPGPFAYSSMALMKDGRVGVLYEQANTSAQVFFISVDIPWIEKGE